MFRKSIQFLWAASLIVAIAQAALAYPEFGERIASHFDGRGRANGYQSKAGFYGVWFFSLAIANVWVPFLGPLMRRTPARWVNLPNKEYWLATPERLAFAVDAIRATLCAILFATNLLLVAVFEQVKAFDRGEGFRMSGGGFVGFTIATVLFGIVYPYIALRVPPEGSRGARGGFGS